MIDKKQIRKEMSSLIRCMDYTLSKAGKKNANPIYFEMYLFLGTHTWDVISRLCEDYIGHDFKVSKKYPTGRCKLCGEIRNKNESKKRIRK